MEIKLKNVSYFKLKEIDITINSREITSIIGDDTKKLLIDLLRFSDEYDGTIYLDNKLLDDNNSIIVVDNDMYFEKPTVITEIQSILKKYSSKYIKKSLDALVIVNLINKKDCLISELSTGEKMLLKIAIALAINPKVIVFDDIFYLLDYKNRKLLNDLIIMMNKRYNKGIILISNNVDYLYRISKKYIVIKNGQVLIDGDKEIFYNQYHKLKENLIDIPQIVEFIQVVKDKKQISLYHRDDIKDLMKDIYRSVI